MGRRPLPAGCAARQIPVDILSCELTAQELPTWPSNSSIYREPPSAADRERFLKVRVGLTSLKQMTDITYISRARR